MIMPPHSHPERAMTAATPATVSSPCSRWPEPHARGGTGCQRAGSRSARCQPRICISKLQPAAMLDGDGDPEMVRRVSQGRRGRPSRDVCSVPERTARRPLAGFRSALALERAGGRAREWGCGCTRRHTAAVCTLSVVRPVRRPGARAVDGRQLGGAPDCLAGAGEQISTFLIVHRSGTEAHLGPWGGSSSSTTRDEAAIGEDDLPPGTPTRSRLGGRGSATNSRE